MKKVLLLLLFLFSFNLLYAQGDILVLHHDTTYTTSLAKRVADRDTLLNNLNLLLASYNQMTFDTNTVLSGLDQYISIILLETSFDVINARYLGRPSRDSLKAWLSGGRSTNKRTLISIGADQGYNYSRSGSTAQDLPLSQGLLKFNYLVDNGSITGFPAIIGVNIDVNNTRTMTTAPVGGGYWPDGVAPLTGSTVLYRYQNRGPNDTVAVSGVNESNYVAVNIFQDSRYFTGGNFYPVLYATMVWAMSVGGKFPGFVPVELTSFAASVTGNTVNLTWTTGSEINNMGFNVERKSADGEWKNIGFVPGYGTIAEQKHYSFTDVKLENGSYSYRLKQVDFDGTFEYSNVVEVDIDVPVQFALQQNYPNPFNPSTKISFSLAADSKVLLKIFNILGQEVMTLVNSNISSGNHSIEFDGSELNSGVYLYKLDATGIDGTSFSSIKKMILTK
jgi:hypothetical protein